MSQLRSRLCFTRKKKRCETVPVKQHLTLKGRSGDRKLVQRHEVTSPVLEQGPWQTTANSVCSQCPGFLGQLSPTALSPDPAPQAASTHAAGAWAVPAGPGWQLISPLFFPPPSSMKFIQGYCGSPDFLHSQPLWGSKDGGFHPTTAPAACTKLTPMNVGASSSFGCKDQTPSQEIVSHGSWVIPVWHICFRFWLS